MRRSAHIDELQIELYVLGSATIAGQRRRIARHLEGCPDCRRIAEEFERIYADAEKHAVSGSSVVALQRRHDPLPVPVQKAVTRTGSFLPDAPVRALGRFMGYCRSHPVVAGVGGTFLLGSVIVGLGYQLRWGYSELNPAGYHYDVTGNYLEVYNVSEDLLWKKPSRELGILETMEGRLRSTFTVVKDLDGDGGREVVTQVPVLLPEGKLVRNLVRIFESGGGLRSTISLGDEISFGRQSYDGDAFGGGGLAVVDVDGVSEVIALAPHWRSPTVVARIGRDGQVKGEYWHYGHFAGIYALPAAGGRGPLIALTGVNDSRDSVGERYPEIVVLDPARLSGKTEASGTRGFGLPISMAEVVQIRLPITEADSVLGTIPVIGAVTLTHDGRMRVLVDCAYTSESPGFGLEYFFDERFRPASVLPLDDPNKTLVRLHREGRLRSLPDAAYYELLRKAVTLP